MVINQIVDIKFTIIDTCYGVTKDGRLFNMKRGKELKKVVIGTTIGYCIEGKFQSLKKLRSKFKKVEENICPF